MGRGLGSFSLKRFGRDGLIGQVFKCGLFDGMSRTRRVQKVAGQHRVELTARE